MDMIEKLAAMIADEMLGPAKYAHCAIEHKADRPKLAETFHAIAKQEAEHMAMLLDAAKAELAAMMEMYNQT